MIILNAGIPRSGTVLVNAMLRHLHEASGRPYQSVNFYGPQLENGLRQAAAMKTDRAHIFHMHDWTETCRDILGGTQRKVVCFANRRDPRDVCVSLLKLHENSLEHTLGLTRMNARLHLQMIRDLGDVEVIRYEQEVKVPEQLLRRLDRVLEAGLSEDDIASILEATSLDAHKKVMETVAKGTGDDVRQIRNSSRVLKEHKDTHINDRHIQSGISGRWQQELSAAEQDLVNRELQEYLVKLGYSGVSNVAGNDAARSQTVSS